MRKFRKCVLAASALSALALPASLLIVPSTAPAWGVTGLTCTKVEGNRSGSLSIQKCGPFPSRSIARGYKEMTGPAASFLDGLPTWGLSGIIFSAWWSNRTSTRLWATSYFPSSSGSCPARDFAQVVSALVLTGGNASVTPPGQVMAMTVCWNRRGRITLEPGTTVSFQPL